MTSCDILLAAYNGERFGPELLDSLLAQTVRDFTLIVRDDGSSDKTLEILRGYQPKFGSRMKIVEEGAPTGSAQGNFSLLMAHSRADHVLFADIDDVWLPNKIATILELLRQAGSEAPGKPAYAFTDAIPVDAGLAPLADSYFQFKKIDPAISQSLSRSLVCPAMLGCASGINRALLERLLPVPRGVTGHDWWGLLVANVFGVVKYSQERTVLYRLHGSNQSSQKQVNTFSYLQSLHRIMDVRHGMARRREQASELLSRFGDSIPSSKLQVIQRFVDTGSRGFLQRRWATVTGNYLYPDMQRNIAMIVGM